jgi:hypothetical protein
MISMSNLSLSIGAIAVLLLLWQWQRTHPAFDLSDLITGENGKVSATKFAQTTALVVSTWGFVTLVQQGKLTEWYFGAYMLAFLGTRIAKDALTKTHHEPA